MTGLELLESLVFFVGCLVFGIGAGMAFYYFVLRR